MASKIYTKTGDLGKTSLIGGTKVPKNHLRIETYGTVDELNSYLGLVGDLLEDAPSKLILKEIQDRLFTVGSRPNGFVDRTGVLLAVEPDLAFPLPAINERANPFNNLAVFFRPLDRLPLLCQVQFLLDPDVRSRLFAPHIE